MTTLYVVIAVATILVWYFMSRSRSAQRDLTLDDVAAEMRVRADTAVATARDDYDIELDFSPGSVESVETILADIHNQHADSPVDRTRMVRESLKWGGYIGECIIRMKNAHWEINSEAGGPGSFPIVYEDVRRESFPVGWAARRITNGPKDNVWHKFDILIIQDVDLSNAQE